MDQFHPAQSEVAARVGQPAAHPGDRKGLAGRSADEDIDRLGAVDKVRRQHVTKVRCAGEPRRVDGGRERLDLRAPPPVDPWRGALGRADAAECGRALHSPSTG